MMSDTAFTPAPVRRLHERMDVYVPDDVDLGSSAMEDLLEALAGHLGLQSQLVLCRAGDESRAA